MAATVFPAPSGESLPILASQKIFETFSADGFMSYRPTGGLPAGRYAVEARGVDVDYLDITAPGFAYQGKGNMAFFQVPAGGAEIQATACTYGDPGFLATARSFSLPTFAFDAEVLGTYTWGPGNQIAYDPTSGNWVAFGNSSSSLRFAASSNGASWTVFGNGLANAAWTHLGDSTSRGIIADVNYAKGALWATSYHPDGGFAYRTTDLTGRSGWSTVVSGGGFNIFGSPNPASNRVFRTEQGQIRYTDNNGGSWTTVTTPGTGNGVYSPAFKGNDIYLISSGRYYSAGQTSKIIKSTNDGASWTEVHDFGTDLVPTSLAYSPTLNRFVAVVAQSASSNGMRIRYSDNDCVSWAYGTGYTSNPSDTNGTYLNWSVTWHNDRFVSAGAGGSGSFSPSSITTSADGIAAFTTVRNTGATIGSLISTSAGVLYRTTGGNQGVSKTTNFTTFTEITSNFANPNGLAYANGIYVITNNTGNVLYGPNLDNLELRSGIPFSLNQVVAGNGVFIAREPSNSSYVISTDGLTWTGGPANSMANIPSFAGGMFFRVDTSRNLFTSIDGVNWTYRARLNTAVDRFSKVKDIYIGYGRLLTGGTTTVNYISRDLINWDSTTSATNGNYWSIAYSETEKIYVGQFNTSTNLVASSSIDFNGLSGGGAFSLGMYLGRTTNSVQINTSNVGRVENIAGLVLGKYGYIGRDGSGSATDLSNYRMFYAWPNAVGQVLIPDTTNNEQISKANGELTVINGSSATIRVKYGKPAVFAVYKLKD